MYPHTCKIKLTAPNVDVAVDLAELSEAEHYVSLWKATRFYIKLNMYIVYGLIILLGVSSREIQHTHKTFAQEHLNICGSIWLYWWWSLTGKKKQTYVNSWMFTHVMGESHNGILLSSEKKNC